MAKCKDKIKCNIYEEKNISDVFFFLNGRKLRIFAEFGPKINIKSTNILKNQQQKKNVKMKFAWILYCYFNINS